MFHLSGVLGLSMRFNAEWERSTTPIVCGFSKKRVAIGFPVNQPDRVVISLQSLLPSRTEVS